MNGEIPYWRKSKKKTLVHPERFIIRERPTHQILFCTGENSDIMISQPRNTAWQPLKTALAKRQVISLNPFYKWIRGTQSILGRISFVIKNRTLPCPSPSANLVGVWEEKEDAESSFAGFFGIVSSSVWNGSLYTGSLFADYLDSSQTSIQKD